MGLDDPFWNDALADGGVISEPRPVMRTGYGPHNPPVVAGYESRSATVRQLQGPLPDISSLPGPVQDFLSDLEGQDPGVAAFLIHNFVRGNMDYSLSQMRGPDPVTYNYRDVMADWQNGDCDNHATMTAALLRYAGIDPQAITYVVADTQVSGGSLTTPPMGHAFVVVNIDGQRIVLDMNFENPMILQPDYTASGMLAADEHPNLSGVTVNVDYSNFLMITPLDSTQDTYANPDLVRQRVQQMSQVQPQASAPTESLPPAPLPTPA